MDCFILHSDTELCNLQRLYISSSYKNVSFGRYAFVILSENEKYICCVYGKNCLREGFCMLDRTVSAICESDFQLIPVEHLQINNIQFIPRISYIKTLSITVLFMNPQETVRWKSCRDSLGILIKEILKLFIVVNNCSISVNRLECAKQLKIHSVIVHNIGNITAGKVVDTTKIKINCIMSYGRYSQSKCLEDKLESSYFIGPANTLKEFLMSQENLSSFTNNSSCRLSPQVLLVGPSGCGKKTLVKKIASSCGIVLVTLDIAEIFGTELIETENFLKEQFQDCILYTEELDGGRCILFLQHLDVIGKKTAHIVPKLLSILDDVGNHPGLTVIASTDKPHLLHHSFCSPSRFNLKIYLGVPTEPERIDILKCLMSDFNCSNETIKEISKLTPGFVIADLALLVQNVYRQMIKKKMLKLESEDELRGMVFNALKIIEASSLRGELGVVHNSAADISPIGGLHNIMLALEQAIHWPLFKPEAFKRLNIQLNTGVLLYGPPGCAKTSLACSIAHSSKCTFLAVSAADLYSPYVGDAERTISHLFQRARAASPTVLFIDEIDALVGSREGRERGSHERVLSAFLTEMDGVGSKRDFESYFSCMQNTTVFVIAATNRPNVLDSALLRPGRFDRLIFVPAPDMKERLNILKAITSGMPLAHCVDLRLLAERTELFSGADLKNLCREAGLCALTDEGMAVRHIKQMHFIKALSEISPSLTRNDLKWFEEFKFS